MPHRLPRPMIAVTLTLLVGCSGAGPGASPQPGDLDALVAAAQQEGTLTTIALAHDVCNYGEMIAAFKEKYGIEVNELDPNAGSGDEIEAIRTNKNNPGPQAPDVIDVGPAFGIIAKDESLIQPYKVATWDTIPEDLRDAEGYWYADYYGVLSFEVNTSVVEEIPTDWADLLDPRYNESIALPGDPRVSNQAIQSVYASALANGGSLDDAAPGLDFWRRLVEVGNFVPTIAKPGTIAQGETPITIRWTYNALANRDALADNPEIAVTIPTSGRFGGYYVQAISAYAPHPNAAKLWMEFVYSDEGQNIFLEGYCHPARYENLVANGRVPQANLERLPDVDGAVFPTVSQLQAATKLISEQWDSVVGVDVAE